MRTEGGTRQKCSDKKKKEQRELDKLKQSADKIKRRWNMKTIISGYVGEMSGCQGKKKIAMRAVLM